MLSTSELEFVKQGGHEVFALVQSKDKERSLREQLSFIELEKARSMKELEINKMKFLKSHHGLVPKTVVIKHGSAKVSLQKKIEHAKQDQRQCQASLKERKDAFMDDLKKRPLSNNSTLRSKQVARLEALRLEDEEKNKAGPLPNYTLQSQDLAMFQQSFQATNQRQTQKRSEQPFINSVNVILESLNGDRNRVSERRQSRQDKFDSLTRHILSTYAGISVETGEPEMAIDTENKTGGTGTDQSLQKVVISATTKQETKNDQAVSNLKDTSPPRLVTKDLTPNAKELNDSDDNSSSDDLSDSKNGGPPNKALQMWAAVRREQRQAKRKRAQEEKARLKTGGKLITSKTEGPKGPVDVSIQIIPPTRSGRRISSINDKQPSNLPPINVSSSYIKKGAANSDGKRSRDGSLSPISPTSPRGPRMSTLLSVDNIHRENDSKNRSRVHSWSSGQHGRPESLSVVAQRRKSVGSRPVKSTFTQHLSVHEEGRSSSSTVVVVHDESNQGRTPRRKSIFSVDNDKHVRGSDNDVVNKEVKDKISFETEEYDGKREASAAEQNDSAGAQSQADSSGDDQKLNSDELNLNLETSSYSARSESTIASLINDKARSSVLGTRDGGAGSRRMSVQTQGALRLWASVQRQEAEIEDGLDGTAYRSAVDSVVEAAAGVDEQVQRLEHVRRSSLSRLPLDLYRRSSIDGVDEKSIEKLRMRRGSVTEPLKGTADVRDEVYKFLQKKFSTSELRRMSLSSVEGQLHSGTTLEDITGRRSSISGQSQPSTSRRGSVIAQNNPQAEKSLRFNEQSAVNEVRKLTAAMDSVRGSSLRRPNTTETTPSNLSRASPSVVNGRPGVASRSNSRAESTSHKPGRSYSWAPDVSNTQDWHILALELLARNRHGVAKFHTVRGLLQSLADEYRKQTANMMYEELRYCTYLRVPKRLLPPDLKDSDVSSIFENLL